MLKEELAPESVSRLLQNLIVVATAVRPITENRKGAIVTLARQLHATLPAQMISGGQLQVPAEESERNVHYLCSAVLLSHDWESADGAFLKELAKAFRVGPHETQLNDRAGAGMSALSSLKLVACPATQSPAPIPQASEPSSAQLAPQPLGVSIGQCEECGQKMKLDPKGNKGLKCFDCRLGSPSTSRKFRSQSKANPKQTSGRRSKVEAQTSPKLVPWAAAIGVAIVLFLGAMIALRPKDSNAPKTAEKVAAQADKKAESKEALRQKKPKKPEKDNPEEKEKSFDFKDGAPKLPKDLGEALVMVMAYESQKKEDLAGIIRLYSEYIDRLPVSADTREFDNRLEALKTKLKTRHKKTRKLLLTDSKALCQREEYKKAKALCQATLKTFKAEDASEDHVDAVEQELALITEQEKSNATLKAILDALPPYKEDAPASDAVLRKCGQALYQARADKELPAFVRLHKRAMAERGKLRAVRYKKAMARLEAAQLAVNTDASDFKKALAERLKLARERTKLSPIDFAGGSRVVGLKENAFTLSAKGGRIEAGFRFGIRPQMTARVLRQACRPKNIDDLVELLVFSLKHDLFKHARFAQKKIQQYDPELGKLLPDLDSLRGRAKLFSGAPIPGRKKAGTLYQFAKAKSPNVLNDWKAYDPKTELKLISNKGLRVTGEDLNLILKEVGFKDGLTVEFDWPVSTEIDGLVSLGLDVLGKKGLRVGAYVSAKSGAVQLVTSRAGEGFKGDDQWIKKSGKDKIRLSAKGKTAILRVGSQVQRIPIPAFQRVVLELDGVADVQKPDNTILWPSLQIEGEARDNWKRKNRVAYKQSIHNATLRFQQAREKLRRIQRQKKQGWDSEDKDVLPSVDDAFTLAALDKKELKAYRLAWQDMEEGNFKEAYEAFTTFISTHDHLPSPYLGQSIIYLLSERYEEAEKHIHSALAIEPNFPEALIFRANMLQAFGKTEDARRDLTKVLKLAPDSSVGYRQRGMLALENNDLKSAIKDLAIAVDLDPTDVETYRHYLSARQVADGPPWEKTFVHESTHFTVKTNISQKRAKEVSDMLEKARMYYATVIPDTTVGKKTNKAVCLVFDTDIGLFNYSALMSGEKHDPQVLGLYTPFYKQLLFFEDKNDVNGDEFRHVLYHEGFHRYSDEVMPGLPIWMDEGLAEFLAGELSTKDGVLEGRLSNLEDGYKYGIIPSVSQLLLMSQAQFYSETGPFNYAAAWALCRYLVRGGAKERERFMKLIAYLQKREPYYLALAKSFNNVDFLDLDRRFQQYVRQMRR